MDIDKIKSHEQKILEEGMKLNNGDIQIIEKFAQNRNFPVQD